MVTVNRSPPPLLPLLLLPLLLLLLLLWAWSPAHAVGLQCASLGRLGRCLLEATASRTRPAALIDHMPRGARIARVAMVIR